MSSARERLIGGSTLLDRLVRESLESDVAEIHLGAATVQNRTGGAARFAIQLPVTSAPPVPEEHA